MKRLLLACLIVFASLSHAQDKVTWIVEKFEPYYILDGKLKGQGAADRLVVLLQKELADMQHEITFMPILRIRESLKNKDHAICVSFLKDKSLAEHVQYSVATMLVPALELTLRREDWEGKWKKASSISLADFMASGAVVGIADGRRYGEKLDPLLADRKRFPKGTYARTGNHYAGLAEMTVQKHVDGTIGYSAEMRYAQKLNPKLENLVSLPVTENTQALYAYTIIPKGPWGDQFRARIDKAILKLRGTPEYKAAMTDWFGQSAVWEQEYKAKVLSGSMDAQSAAL
jgi:uncharacterized protein (TIGR02285 family)